MPLPNHIYGAHFEMNWTANFPAFSPSCLAIQHSCPYLCMSAAGGHSSSPALGFPCRLGDPNTEQSTYKCSWKVCFNHLSSPSSQHLLSSRDLSPYCRVTANQHEDEAICQVLPHPATTIACPKRMPQTVNQFNWTSFFYLPKPTISDCQSAAA